MFKKPATEPTAIDILINTLTHEMQTTPVASPEYAKMLDHLVKLESIQKDNRPEKLSADQMASIIANALGILAILNFERTGVVTSKALGFITRLR